MLCNFQLVIPETRQNKMQLVAGSLKPNMTTTLNNFIVTHCYMENPDPNRVNIVINLKRISAPFVTSLFIPSICLILAAEITLFIDEKHFKATISVALTTNLVMYTMYRTIQEKLPENSALKLIDIWLLHGLLMPMVVFILLATKELTNTTTSSKEVPKSNFIKVTDSSLISLNNKTTTEDGEIAKKNNVLLVCQALVPVLTMIFILTFFIIMCQTNST